MAVWVPKAGALVELRGACYRVRGVEASAADPRQPTQHWVQGEALDPQLPDLSVLWEHEVGARVLDEAGLPGFSRSDGEPQPAPWSRFRAFVLARRWATIREDELQAPFRTGLKPAGHQLVPLARALERPRINLLIADDVGLGKTIEAGLIVQELIALKRVRRVLIVCPAALRQQWRDELKDHFNLEFDLLDRRKIKKIRQRYSSGLNPWKATTRAIVSMDFLKREEVLEDFLDATRDKATWDLLLVDEAHHLTASDSDRARMARKLTPHFEHRLFLTATPHRGSARQFQALLQLLDPGRFPADQRPAARDIRHAMLRRRKRDTDLPPQLQAPKRSVSFIPWRMTARERELHEALDRYIASLQDEPEAPQAVGLLASLFKKRALSSLPAFRNSLEVHLAALREQQLESPRQQQLFLDENWFNDEEKHREELRAVALSTRELGAGLSARSRDRLGQLREAAAQCDRSGKSQALLKWLQSPSHRGEKVVIFTEFRDTLRHLMDELGSIPRSFIQGGMTEPQRQRSLEEFLRPGGARLLLATDAACEGLNLQRSCARLLHFETPWNPCRMEQRNGRVDRIGQREELVHCLHFVCAERRDDHLLKVLVTKINRVRRDLGPIGRVIARRIEQSIVRRDVAPIAIEDARDRHHRQQLAYKRQARRLLERLKKSRKRLQCRPKDIRFVIDQALAIEGAAPLARRDRHWALEDVPRRWRQSGDSGGLTPQSLWSDRPGEQKARPLHLNASIVQRSIESLQSLKHCVTAIPCPGRQPQLVVFTQVTWVNREGVTIHEENRTLWALVEGPRLLWRRARKPPGWANLGEQQRLTLPLPEETRAHAKQIRDRLKRLERREKSRARALLGRLRQKRQRCQSRLIRKRLKDVESLLAHHEENPGQRSLWKPSQWLLRGTEAWELERCREGLLEERQRSARLIKRRFQLHRSRGIHIETYAFLYGIPTKGPRTP